MSLAEHVLRRWAEHPERGTPFVARHERPGRAAQTRPLPDWLAPGVLAGLQARGITQLYRHQVEALDLINAGQDVVVATPTASGKSLIYHLAVLNACAADEGVRALYLFPTKALAQDQVVSLDALADACGVEARPHAFDGDTPADARRVIRRAARVVVSNPDMLHRTLLPQHDRWASFFAGLRFVVLDEVHSYRGVFGSHVANVLRRLRRICRFHGSDPRFVLCSATIANPQQHAEALLERPVAAVTASGAPHERSTFYVYNPPLVDGAKGIRQSYVQAARRLTRALAREEVPTIVFANSRLNVERLTRHLQEDVAAEGLDPTTVSGYRGGYLPEHRRAIEAGLRSGHVRTVVSTSALELGVDVGQLEACVLAGYPGSIASLWQRAGRAGRRDAPAVVVLVARSEAVDQYLAAHPEALFESPEHALLDAGHLLIVADHIKCAAFELPFTVGEAFGGFEAERTAQVLGWLAARRLLLQGQQRWQWTGEPWPAQGVALRSIAEGNFTVLDRAHDHRIVGEVDFHGAPSTLHPQAIYLVGGESFQVLELDWTGRRAVVEPVDVDYYTDAVTHEGLSRLASFNERRLGTATVGHGEVRVFEQVVGFKKIRFATGENVGYGEVQLPETELHTTAFWLSPPPDLGLRLALPLHKVADALDGLLQALRQVAAIRVMGAPRDLGSAAVGEGDAEGLPTLYLYERYPGGVGLHETLFEQAEALLADADRLLGGCGCEDGCPVCVGAAALGELRSRRRVRQVLAALRGELNAPAVHLAGWEFIGVSEGPEGTCLPSGESDRREEALGERLERLMKRRESLLSSKPPRVDPPVSKPAHRPLEIVQPVEKKELLVEPKPTPVGVAARLDALLSTLGGPAPLLPSGPRLALPLEGEESRTPHGRCFVVRTTLPPEHRHGDRQLGPLSRRAAADAALLARDAAFSAFDPRAAVFLDLETTSLAHGLGNLAFLLGIAWFQGDCLILEQWLLRDPDEEAAALSALGQRLEEADWLVSFNGRSFDLPLLATRFALHHLPLPPLLGHLDLLPITRRLLKHGLPNCRLATVEAVHLGLQRVGDVKGSQVPAAWLEHQHGGSPHALVGVVKHNRDDILSLVTLLDFLLERAASAESLMLRDPPAALALAAAALALGAHARAEALYHTATAFPETATAGRKGLERLRRLQKKGK